MNLSKLLSFSAVCMIAAQVAFAQNSQEEELAENYFRLVSLDNTYTDFAYDYKREPVELYATTGSFSPKYPLPSNRVIEFYREEPAPVGSPPNSPPMRIPLAKVELKPEWDQALIMLIAAPAGSPLPMRGLAIDAIPEQHTHGTARLINLSKHQAALSFGKEPTKSGPRDINSVISFPMGISRMILAVEYDNEWHPVTLLQRRLDENTRIFTIVIDRKPTPENPLPVNPYIIFEYDRSLYMKKLEAAKE